MVKRRWCLILAGVAAALIGSGSASAASAQPTLSEAATTSAAPARPTWKEVFGNPTHRRSAPRLVAASEVQGSDTEGETDVHRRGQCYAEEAGTARVAGGATGSWGSSPSGATTAT